MPFEPTNGLFKSISGFFHLFGIEIRDANCLCQAEFVDTFHPFPCLEKINVTGFGEKKVTNIYKIALEGKCYAVRTCAPMHA